MANVSDIWKADEVQTLGTCVFCLSNESQHIARRADGLMINECVGCGLAYVDPRPSRQALARYYSNGYFSGEKDFFKGKDYCAERDAVLKTGYVTGQQELISHFDLKGKRILDIGCASGSLLYSLKKYDPLELVGIDTAQSPLEFGRERYGLDLKCTDLESASLPSGHFDLIALIDVIEHVENLRRFLNALRRILNAQGSILIVTPNYYSYNLARENWACLHQDFEHLHYFSPQSLTETASRTGFRVKKMWTDGIPFLVKQYPKILSNRLHYLFYPNVAIHNRIVQLKFNRAFSKDASSGLILYAILSAG